MPDDTQETRLKVAPKVASAGIGAAVTDQLAPLYRSARSFSVPFPSRKPPTAIHAEKVQEMPDNPPLVPPLGSGTGMEVQAPPDIQRSAKGRPAALPIVTHVLR